MRFNVLFAAAAALLPAFSAATSSTAKSVLGSLENYTSRFKALEVSTGVLGVKGHENAPKLVAAGLVDINAIIAHDISLLGAVDLKVEVDAKAEITAAFKAFVDVAAEILVDLSVHVGTIVDVDLSADVSVELEVFEHLAAGLAKLISGLGVDAVIALEETLKVKLDACIDVFAHVSVLGVVSVSANVEVELEVEAKIKAIVALLVNVKADIKAAIEAGVKVDAEVGVDISL